MVNRKLKKCASLFLVMSMAVSMLAGCGSKNATEIKIGRITITV